MDLKKTEEWDIKPIEISKHAEERLKGRCGLNKKACKRIVQKAFDEGIKHSQTKGRLNKWITSLYFKNQRADNIRIYGDKAYIFCSVVLVTVIQVPVSLMKDLKNMVKNNGITQKEGVRGYGKTYMEKRKWGMGASWL